MHALFTGRRGKQRHYQLLHLLILVYDAGKAREASLDRERERERASDRQIDREKERDR